MKKRQIIAIVSCSIAVSFGAVSAHAQFASPDNAIKYRQAALTVMASHFGRMQPVIRGQAPYDAAQLKENVDILKTLAALPWAGFGPGTEGGNAKPEIWRNSEDFKAKEQNLINAVGKLSAAADSGDLARVRAAFGEVGASCKACHAAYRK